MGAIVLTIIGVIVYIVVGCWISEAKDDDALFVLWPLFLAKEILKGLYRVLFTGWRE